MSLVRFRFLVACLVAVLLAGLVTVLANSESASALEPSTAPGTFTPLPPTRILDTSTGNGATANIPAKGSITVQVTGRGGVPATGVSSAALNLQAVTPGSNGYLTLHADGTTRPAASNLNFTKNVSISTLAVASLATWGAITIYNGGTTAVRVIADLAGYYVSGTPTTAGSFASLAPTRILDTGTGVGAAANIPAKGTITVQVGGRGGVPATDVASAVLNLQAVTPGANGYLTLHAAGTSRPAASNLNFTTSTTISTLAVAPLSASGAISIFNGGTTAVRVIADLAGYHLTGSSSTVGTFGSLAPARILDTGVRVGAQSNIPARGSIQLQVAGQAGVPTSGAGDVVLNLQAVSPVRAGYLTLHAAGTARPSASNLNFSVGRSISTLAVAPLGNTGSITIYNGSDAEIRVIADVAGFHVSTAPTALTWTDQGTVSTQHGRLQSVSCPTTTFCAAVDFYGNALTYNGTAWSARVAIADDVFIRSVSCPTATFCAAVGDSGVVSTFDGATWAVPTIIPGRGQYNSVSCATPTFCKAVNAAGTIISFDGAHWTPPTYLVGSGFHPQSISCPNVSFCAVVGANAEVVTTSGIGWSYGYTLNGTELFISVSCVSSISCQALTSDGQIARYDGTYWDGTNQFFGESWRSISCRTETFCVAVGDLGVARKGSGANWTPIYFGSDKVDYESVSCASPTACVAVGDGQAAKFNGISWSAPVTIDAINELTSVSCPTTTFCAALGWGAEPQTFDGTAWSEPAVSADPSQYLESVSCFSPTFCAAVGYYGAVSTFNGSTWSASTLAAPVDLDAVSCPTADRCFAVGYYGDVYSFNGTTWTSQGNRGLELSSISCTSTTFCVAVGDSDALVLKGTTWSHISLEYQAEYLLAVSCASDTYCLAVGVFGQVLKFNGTAWSAAVEIDRSAYLQSVSCPSASFCVAIDDIGRAFVLDGALWAVPVSVASGVYVQEIDCATEDFCVVVSRYGQSALGTR